MRVVFLATFAVTVALAAAAATGPRGVAQAQKLPEAAGSNLNSSARAVVCHEIRSSLYYKHKPPCGGAERTGDPLKGLNVHKSASSAKRIGNTGDEPGKSEPKMDEGKPNN